MIIILLGPPGAGKGTQADKISSTYKLDRISTGDLLREEVKKETSLGSKIKSLIEKGKFVPDDIINDLILKILSNKKFYNRIIFDGYPRNLEQAKNLNIQIRNYKQNISRVLSLNVQKDVITKRILGRQTCTKCGLIFNEFFNPSTIDNHNCDPKFLSKRADDNSKTISDRYEDYIEKTLPILDYYKKQNLLKEVNGTAEINQIFQEIQGILGPLEA